MTTTLTAQNFNEFIANDKLVLVDFWAEWCMPCRMLAPVLESLSNDYTVGKVNIEEEPELTNRFGIAALPTLAYFRNGQIVRKVTGSVPKDAIIKTFAELA